MKARPTTIPALYIHGVVNQEIPNLTTELSADEKPKKHVVLDPTQPANPVTLFSGGNTPPQRLRYEFDGAEEHQGHVPCCGRPRSSAAACTSTAR